MFFGTHIVAVFASAALWGCGMGKAILPSNFVSTQYGSMGVQKNGVNGKTPDDSEKECPTIDVAGSNLNLKLSAGCATAVAARPAAPPPVSTDAGRNPPGGAEVNQKQKTSSDDKDAKSLPDANTSDKEPLPPKGPAPTTTNDSGPVLKKTSTAQKTAPAKNTSGSSSSGMPMEDTSGDVSPMGSMSDPTTNSGGSTEPMSMPSHGNESTIESTNECPMNGMSASIQSDSMLICDESSE